MTARCLLMVSGSAALHLAAVTLLLAMAGVVSAPPLFVDLVADSPGSRARAGEASAPAPLADARRSAAAGAVPAARPAATAAPPEPAAFQRPDEPAAPPATAPSPILVPGPESTPPPATVASSPGAQPQSGAESSSAERAGPAGGAARVTGAPTVAGGGGAPRLGAGGSLLAGATSGEGRGGVPPEYRPYLQRFRQRLQEALVYPLMARRQGLSGTVELEVLLEPTGRVRDVRVVSSSSHAVLDDAAVESVRSMVPVPLPDSLPRRPLRIRVPLVFQLR